MQTHFSPAQLADPQFAETNRILRTCVRCGFCTATCPTYLLTGDELDGPRGRIYLAKEMLEHDRPADPVTVKHLDRCLTCLACMTTCPSGVHYMHLIDHARHHIERTARRPLQERMLRALLAFVLPRRNCFRAALRLARLVRPLRAVLPRRVRNLLDAAAAPAGAVPPRSRTSGLHTGGARPAQADRAAHMNGKPSAKAADVAGIRRVALLPGCVQPALRPQINEAAVRVLNRCGVEVVIAKGTACCGALVHHLGRHRAATAQARADIDAWTAELEGRGLDAIIVTASGCGTMLKDYGFLFRDDAQYAHKAARVAALARDITEVIASLMPPERARAAASKATSAETQVPATGPPLPRVAYHSACSLQHGQQLHGLGPALLRNAGFTVLDVPEGHLCCGSAGTYSFLQPVMSAQLRERKARNIESVQPDVIATGNIGCIAQIARATRIPIVHTVELLDWAGGGPAPLAWPPEAGSP